MCAFSCCHFLCVSPSWWFRAAPWATRQGEKERARKETETLGFQNESQVSRRDFYAICVNTREFDLLPFVLPQRMTQALTPAVNRRWTSANDGQILQCSGKRHSVNALEEKCWCWVLWSKHNRSRDQQCQTPAWSSTLRGFFHWSLSPAALLPPQGRVCWCRREVTSPWQNQSDWVQPQTCTDDSFLTFHFMFLHFCGVCTSDLVSSWHLLRETFVHWHNLRFCPLLQLPMSLVPHKVCT